MRDGISAFKNPAPALYCVVLFDIDGTLVTGPKGTTSAGVRAMNAASVATTGQPSRFNGKDYAGRTDRQIARMLLVDGGDPNPTRTAVDTLIRHYVVALAETIREVPFVTLGRPREAIEALRASGALVGLGTGNVRAGARLKLESAGIADLFEFENGGFGEDGDTRAELLANGARMINPARDRSVVIVGDTPHDIEGARGMGARSVGVPFGAHDRASLEQAGADRVIDGIDAALDEVVRSLFG